MSTLTQKLVDAGYSARRAEAIEAAILAAVIDAANVEFTPAGNIAADNVQDAIEELDTEKAAVSHTHTVSEITDAGDLASADDASGVPYSNTTSGLTATDVQAAIDEAVDLLAPPQRNYDEYTSNADLTTALPLDDTIPQNTEGTEILSASITLTRSNSRVRIRFQGWGVVSGIGVWSAAIFGSASSAIAAGATASTDNDLTDPNTFTPLVLEVEVVPGSVGPHTFSVRAGSSDGAALRLNGTASGRLFGGASRATLVIEEVFVTS